MSIIFHSIKIKQMSNVVVCADAQGRVIHSTSNPEFGYVRLEQVSEEYNESGWGSEKKRSTLIKNTIDKLEERNFKAGEVLPGNIVIRESLTPFNVNNAEREIKLSGENGVVCRFEDQPIYRTTFWDRTGSKEDVLISHTNGEEIKEARLFSKVLSAKL